LLIAFDLEGTLIRGELLPEIGRRIGKPELADITSMGMSGAMSYGESLRRRIAVIAGTGIGVASEASQSLPPINGATEAFREFRRKGWKTAIITGGFDVSAEPFAKAHRVDYVYSNRFKVEGGRIAGVEEPLVTPERKLEVFIGLARGLGLGPEECVAVGDGANDIPMIGAAGLGIALNAKPIVRKTAELSIDTNDLRTILPHLERFAAGHIATILPTEAQSIYGSAWQRRYR